MDNDTRISIGVKSMEKASGSRRILLQTVIRRFLLFIVIMGTLFFAPAGTFQYWEAWLYMGILLLPMAFVLFYLIRHDPELLERRMRTREKEREQRLLMRVSTPLLLIIFLLPGFDIRFSWSAVPAGVVIAADVIVLSGYLLFFRVLRENRYLSRIVEVEPEQTLVSTGPYAIIRHPMYLAAMVMYLFSPLALGSWWASMPAVLFIVVFIVRIRNEEAVLLRGLAGYREYTEKTKYRLFPGIW